MRLGFGFDRYFTSFLCLIFVLLRNFAIFKPEFHEMISLQCFQGIFANTGRCITCCWPTRWGGYITIFPPVSLVPRRTIVPPSTELGIH